MTRRSLRGFTLDPSRGLGRDMQAGGVLLMGSVIGRSQGKVGGYPAAGCQCLFIGSWARVCMSNFVAILIDLSSSKSQLMMYMCIIPSKKRSAENGKMLFGEKCCLARTCEQELEGKKRSGVQFLPMNESAP